MSCFITFMPRETEVLMRYKAMPGIAQRMTASAEIISGSKRRRSPKSRMRKIDRVATTADWATAIMTAIRNSARARLIADCIRARDERW